MQFSFMSLSAAAVRQYTKAHSARRLSECLCGCVCVAAWSDYNGAHSTGRQQQEQHQQQQQ